MDSTGEATDMKSLLSLVGVVWAAFCCQPAIASEVYANWEYSFSVQLAGDEKICSQDAHGVTIAFEPAECGHADVYISAMYNGPLYTAFPIKSYRESCHNSPILGTGLRLEGREWLSCVLHSSPKRIELFYFNQVIRPAKASIPWMFLSVDARLLPSEVDSSKRQLNALISRIAVKN